MRRLAAPQWSSRVVFIFAAVGSAVGLGNIWRFPYMAGENGGAAFVLVYIGFVVFIGLPVLIAELAIGRRGRMSPIRSIRNVAEESGSTKRWSWIGHLSSLGGGLGLLAFYSVIAGWVLAYIIKAASGMFAGFGAADSAAALNTFYADTPVMVAWHFVFIAITVYIVGKGINAGLEKAVIYLMPIMSEGRAMIDLHVIRMDDDSDVPIGPQIRPGTLAVMIGCPTLPGATTSAQDMDDDGRCEDVNGNGR